jgi:hypothetical protein
MAREKAVNLPIARWLLWMSCPALVMSSVACSPFGPSCRDETGDVLRTNGKAEPGTTLAYTVVSPKHSNLIISVSWSDPVATLDVRATITACGAHLGCQMLTSTPPPPLPGTLTTSRQMLVDGTRGKAYLVEVVGDSSRDTAFSLVVTYDISCER